MNQNIGYIGLGKMGRNMAYRLKEKGWNVVAYNRSPKPRREAAKNGVRTVASVEELVSLLKPPRLVWLMVAHEAVDSILGEVLQYAQKGDTVIDGGNSNYLGTIQNARLCKRKGVNFLDVGISGGPEGARKGACCMIGGERKIFKQYERLFKDISVLDGYGYFGRNGAGHFVKMVHNGIEYGMMQAIAEGFTVMKRSTFNLNLTKVADVYNHRSVIESRLVGWLQSAYEKYGENLLNISGFVAHSGEGEWTVKTAKKLGVPVPIIEGALKFRVNSKKNPSYTGKVVSALRNQFGGHEVKK